MIERLVMEMNILVFNEKEKRFHDFKLTKGDNFQYIASVTFFITFTTLLNIYETFHRNRGNFVRFEKNELTIPPLLLIKSQKE